MVNPGSFRGIRKEFLIGEKPTYKAAITGGYAGDALANIQRRFLKRFSINLPDSVDPTPEVLAAVDDDTPDEEYEAPDQEKMTVDEFSEATRVIEDRQHRIQFRKDVRRTQSDEIESKHKRRALASGVDRKNLAALCEAIAKEMFSKVESSEREEWKLRAKEEHDADVAKWKKAMTDGPSTEPADCQRCIQALTKFVQPILDGICAATGWKASLIAGGPEPAHSGRLNILSVHSGMTTGLMKLTYGRAEKAAYKKYVLDSYGRFLKKCYTVEECRSCALPEEEGFESLTNIELEAEGAELHHVSLNGLDRLSPEKIQDTGADSMITEHESDGLPINTDRSAALRALSPHQSPINSRLLSLVGLSPNPSQDVSPALDTVGQSHPAECPTAVLNDHKDDDGLHSWLAM